MKTELFNNDFSFDDSLYHETLEAANNGDPNSQTMIGYYCFQVRHDVKKAFEWFTKAANNGNPEAINNLGVFHLLGIPKQKDENKAFEYFLKAAEIGFAYAQFNLGECFFLGKGSCQDHKKALQWYLAAADNGLPEAMYKSGNCYYYGAGCDIDEKKALSYYTLAAEHGLPQAQYKVGLSFWNGFGTTKDKEKALEIFFDLADKDYFPAQEMICRNFNSGSPLSAKTFNWVKKAAEKGIPIAQYYLGLDIYCVSNEKSEPGRWVVPAETRELYEAAANKGLLKAKVNLVEEEYRKKRGDAEKAKYVDELTKLAEQGSGDACQRLGSFFQFRRKEEEIKKAEFWMNKRIEYDEEGYHDLAFYYRFGLKNKNKAYEILLTGANRGDIYCLEKLEECYREGIGCDADETKAFECYLKELGSEFREGTYDNVFLKIGKCYLDGVGVSANRYKARYWFQKAAELGIKEANELLKNTAGE